jgi:hypothetical protein
MKFESFIWWGVDVRSLGVPAVSSFDTSASICGKHVCATGSEGVGDGSSCAHDEADGVSHSKLASFGLFALHVVFPEDVFVVKVLSENDSQLVGSVSRVSLAETSQVSADEFGKVLNLAESFFEIVGDREALEPVLEEFSGHGRVGGQGVLTVLDDLTERGDGVVTGMVELVQFLLLLLDLGVRSHLDTSLEGGEALVHDGGEVFGATASGNNTDSIGGSLTERRGARGDEATDGLDEDLVIGRFEVAGTEVLNDIIENE